MGIFLKIWTKYGHPNKDGPEILHMRRNVTYHISLLCISLSTFIRSYKQIWALVKENCSKIESWKINIEDIKILVLARQTEISRTNNFRSPIFVLHVDFSWPNFRMVSSILSIYKYQDHAHMHISMHISMHMVEICLLDWLWSI